MSKNNEDAPNPKNLLWAVVCVLVLGVVGVGLGVRANHNAAQHEAQTAKPVVRTVTVTKRVPVYRTSDACKAANKAAVDLASAVLRIRDIEDAASADLDAAHDALLSGDVEAMNAAQTSVHDNQNKLSEITGDISDAKNSYKLAASDCHS